MKVKPVNIKRKKVTLANTCAFDSIFQLFLAAIFDSDVFENKCKEMTQENVFFQIIRDTSTKGIPRNTYTCPNFAKSVSC